jgi:PAS domain S-box-containing protein
MIGAEDALITSGTINAGIAALAVIISGYFGYLGLKAQLIKNGNNIDRLTEVNTEQHGVNHDVLQRMLNAISEQGVMISTVVSVQERPIIKTDAEGSLIQVNAAGVKLLGMTPAELAGDGWANAVHPADRHRVFEAWTESLRTTSPFGPISYRYRHPATGVDTLVEAVATPVFGIDHQLISWVAIVVPITEV